MFFRCFCCRRRKIYKTTPVLVNYTRTKTVRLTDSQQNGHTARSHHPSRTVITTDPQINENTTSQIGNNLTTSTNGSNLIESQITQTAATKQSDNTENLVTDQANNSSTETIENKSSNLFENKSSSLSENKSSNLVENKSSNLSENKSSSLSENKSSNLSENKSSNLVENESSNLSENKSSNFSENKSSSLSENKSSNLTENKSSSLSENKSSNLSENKSSNLVENESSNLFENKSSNLSEPGQGAPITDSEDTPNLVKNQTSYTTGQIHFNNTSPEQLHHTTSSDPQPQFITPEVPLEDKKSTDDMRKISIDIDNSDIGQVPLSIRSSISHPVSKAPKESEIKEEEEQTSDSNGNSDGGVNPGGLRDGSSSTVTFSLRREGIREAVNVDTKKEIPNYLKSIEDVTHIKSAITANDFFANVLTEESLNKVVGALKERKVERGTVILEEGEPGNNMYISSRGTYEVYIKKKLYSTFNDKRVFGELAILYNSNRAATIKAVTDGKVWVLQRSVYQQIMVQSAIQDLEQTMFFLGKVPLVNNLSDDSLTKIANILKKEFFKTDTIIVQEGYPGDKFYIIRAGCVTVTKKNEGKVSELGKGAFFGERALLKDDVRQATVIANAPGVECLTLTREEFKKHFNDNLLMAEPQPNGSKRKPKRDQEDEEQVRPTNEYSSIKLHELEKKATLGVGGFGRVELVQHKHNSKLTFALKYLKKIDMVQQDQITHVFNERNIQIACDSVFIARLYNTFQDNKYLYFLMECCLGGDLWTYLQKRKGRMVPEAHARFYTACVLEAFAYLHERDFIYRDLKPENLLIDAKGYIKLTDFGFAKSLQSILKTYTFAGTPEYVAPEIIYNRGHDKSVDYWAFGILIFELLVGKTPFRTDDHTNMMTYNRILKGISSVTFPSHITNSAKHLIQKLCRALPTDRLGCQKNGIQDIRNHNFFHGFDWEKLRNQNIKPPFVPKLSGYIDTKYFEKFSEDEDTPPDETTSFPDF